MDEKIAKLFLPVVDKLYNTEPAGEPFRNPVDVVKYGCFDYYLYVKHPIDLSTIRRRLEGRHYKDAWRFVADMELMFSNAYLFNKKGTPVHEYTNKLNKIWLSEAALAMRALNYCCATLHKFGPQLLFCHGTTPERYCQIAVGAKYRCYQDQYSFCLACFNRIDADAINIQSLSQETTRMKLPQHPVRKADFVDCTNDGWQYESFIQCSLCSRRVHQICEIYPASECEITHCLQHEQLEAEQKALCQVPEEYRVAEPEEESEQQQRPPDNSQESTGAGPLQFNQDSAQQCHAQPLSITHPPPNSPSPTPHPPAGSSSPTTHSHDHHHHHHHQPAQNSASHQSELNSSLEINVQEEKLNNELCEYARLILDSTQTGAKETCQTTKTTQSKNSVDNIAARLSINKMSAEADNNAQKRDKFMCNHCYRKKNIGYNMRHRKFSARRLPHTRMSRYIETKVNEQLREISPTAGQLTVRVLTAYRDTVEVKPEMRAYVKKCREKLHSQQHPCAKDYPDSFGFTNRAIFAWQEIDSVDVCVFGMHVQEYGEDCQEPNKQVIYLSYLDSVHFFRPKQYRTTVYHEILLSYFKYVKKLGFKRVFIWVCPSRKGDDYIFYRHPTEQKMPTLRRLSDWYLNLLDKGVMAGIVEKHHSIYQFVASQNDMSPLSMPYLSGDYWPGEFERLLKIMIETEGQYAEKMQKQVIDDTDTLRLESLDQNKCISTSENLYPDAIEVARVRQSSSLSLEVCQSQPNFSHRSPLINSLRLKSNDHSSAHFTPNGDIYISAINESKLLGCFTPESCRSECDQPLDLSKSSSINSPESFFDDDRFSELSFTTVDSRKRRSRSTLGGRGKKRSKISPQSQDLVGKRNTRQLQSIGSNDLVSSKLVKSAKQKSGTQSLKDSLFTDNLPCTPEEELMKNLEKSLKRQKDGFIVARLSDCDCPANFESQRRKEEATIVCDLMKGREPFLQLTRQKNYEFSSLRRAKFSSLAMVKHLAETFKLDPICNECYSFDPSKRHYACTRCEDYYLCTSCHENTQHAHIMSLTAPIVLPDIDEFLQQCSLASTSISISSASSTISNKSFNDANIEVAPSQSSLALQPKQSSTQISTPLNHHLSNSIPATMPLSCQRQNNRSDTLSKYEDEENSDLVSFNSGNKSRMTGNGPPTSPGRSSDNNQNSNELTINLDQILIENFVRQAEVTYDVDFDQMKGESKKLLTHYWNCPNRESCHKCKFVVLSCSFMSALMKSSRMQMMINCNPSEILPSNISNSNHSGINLTTTHQFGYQSKEK